MLYNSTETKRFFANLYTCFLINFSLEMIFQKKSKFNLLEIAESINFFKSELSPIPEGYCTLKRKNNPGKFDYYY